jgi:hypothetical protein
MNSLRAKHGVPDENLPWLALVQAQVNSLQFGTVEIVVHDARVVQIQRTERVRLGQSEAVKPVKGLSSAPTSSASARLAADDLVQANT